METRGSIQESSVKKKKQKKKVKTSSSIDGDSSLQHNKGTSESSVSEKESSIQQQNSLISNLVAQKSCIQEGSTESPVSENIDRTESTLSQPANKKKKKKKKKSNSEVTDNSTDNTRQISCTSNETPVFICNPEITITPINPVKKKKKKKKKNKTAEPSTSVDNTPDTGCNEISLCTADLLPENTVATVNQASNGKNSVCFNNRQTPLECVFPSLENTKRAKDSKDVILLLDGVVVFPQLQKETSADSLSSGVVSITKSGNITRQENISEKPNISYQGTKETHLFCTEKIVNGKDTDIHNPFLNDREQKITEASHFLESNIIVNTNALKSSKTCSCVEIDPSSTTNFESVDLLSETNVEMPETVKMPEGHTGSKGQSATNCVEDCAKSDQKTKALLKAERKAAFEAQRAAQLTVKKAQGEDQNDSQQKSKAQLRAERRALQEAQRAAKTSQKNESAESEKNVLEQSSAAIGDAIKTSLTAVIKNGQVKLPLSGTGDVIKKRVKVSAGQEHGPKVQRAQKFRLFSHLPQHRQDPLLTKDLGMSGSVIHPAIIRVGLQMSQGIICGSNARCLAMLVAFKEVIKSYVTPSHKELSRDLESKIQPYISFLTKCRPLSVSMDNAVKFLKFQITHISPDMKDFQAREKLCSEIDTFIKNEIFLARDQIVIYADQKINDDDVILTYGCSSLVKKVLCAAHENKKKFRVIVVDARPKLEGREMLRYLVKSGIHCSYVLINSVSYVMKEVSKVILGAHSLQANGYVMSRVGSSQIALVAHAYNVPVLVCCETYKFCERAHTDSFVYNELGNPDDLVKNVPSGKGILQSWREIPSLRLLNLVYDVTPPDLVAMVIYEKGMLPCTSVPVVLRVKQSVS